MNEIKTVPVTMVLSVYNDSRFLGQAFEGLMGQTVLPERVLLLDDASTDDSLDIMRQFQLKYSDWVEIVVNEENLGVVASYLKGLHLVKTEFTWIRATDDVYLPQYLEKKYQVLSENPKAAFVFSDMGLFKNDPRKIMCILKGWGNETTYFSPEDVADNLSNLGPINCHALMRTEMLKSFASFSPRLRWHIDWFWNTCLAFTHGICYIPKALSLMCSRDDSYSAGKWRDPKEIDDTYAYILDELENSIYAKHKHLFIRSRAFSVFGSSIAEFVIKNPFYQSESNRLLLDRNFYLLNKQDDERPYFRTQVEQTSELERSLSKRLNFFVPLIRSKNIKKIALYGAGAHSELLLKLLSEKANFLEVVSVLVTSSPRNDDFMGIPCVGIGDVNIDSFDAVIISSKSYEEDMMSEWINRYPEKMIYRIWHEKKSSLVDRDIEKMQKVIPEYSSMLAEFGISEIALITSVLFKNVLLRLWNEYSDIKVSHVFVRLNDQEWYSENFNESRSIPRLIVSTLNENDIPKELISATVIELE